MANKKSKQKSQNETEELPIEATMAGPLWARATYSPQYPDILDDPKSVEILNKLDVDFTQTQEFCGEFLGLNFLVRARYFDDKVQQFIQEYPNCTVVNIGCGMDTTITRVDNGTIKWYDLDLPEAIAYRKQYISETPRSKCISKSVLDLSWFDDIEFTQANGIFFFAAGLFNYFKESEVSALCIKMVQRFPNGELVFDVPSRFGVKILNRRLKGMGLKGIKMYFGVGNPKKQLSKWSDKIQVVDWFTLFSKIPRNPKWEKNTRRLMNASDRFKMGKYIHLKFLS